MYKSFCGHQACVFRSIGWKNAEFSVVVTESYLPTSNGVGEPYVYFQQESIISLWWTSIWAWEKIVEISQFMTIVKQ